MRGRVLLWSFAGLLGAVALGVALLLFTPPGLSQLGRLAENLSGGAVRLEGLSGSPNHLRAVRVEIADQQGIWLAAEQVSLDWSAWALLAGRVDVRQLQARSVTVFRRPVRTQSEDESGPDIAIGRLQLPRILLQPSLTGRAVTLSAEGSLRYAALDALGADLRIARAGNQDRYIFAGRIADGAAQGHVTLREGPDGILGRLAGLPQLGPVNLEARAEGTRQANRLSLDLSAGPLRAQGDGLLRLAQDSADLALRLSSPAMSLRPDLSWERLEGMLNLRGDFRAPQISGRLLLEQGRAGGLAARTVELAVRGSAGTARLEGMVAGLMLPGDHPAIFAAAPWRIEAEADLQAIVRPVRFVLHHRLARLEGEARTKGGFSAEADLTVPSLAPFAALENVRMGGQAALHVTLRQAGSRLALAADGRLSAAGEALAARMLGGKARLRLAAQMQGADIVASQVRLDAAGFNADIGGSLRGGELDYRLALGLPDLRLLARSLRGALSLNGMVQGPIGAATLSANGTATMATEGFAPGRLALRLRAGGLPTLKDGRLDITGNFNDAPLAVHGTFGGEKARRLRLEARWKSALVVADLTPEPAPEPALSGTARLSVATLSDLASFTGPLEGSVEAAARFAKNAAELRLTAADLKRGGLAIARLSGNGRVQAVWDKPLLDLTLAADGLAWQEARGAAQARLEGPLSALMISGDAKLDGAATGAVQARMQSRLDVPSRELHITALGGAWRGVEARLLSPMTLRYGAQIAIEDLNLRLGAGTLSADGILAPQLALRAAARGMRIEDFRPLFPRYALYNLRGNLSGEAELSGTPERPLGKVSLSGSDLRSTLAGVPPGTLHAELRLDGARARADVSLQAGARMRLLLTGEAPLARDGTLNLSAEGRADLALLDPILAADGRRARGVLAFHAAIQGTPAAPRLAGSGTLAEGEFQDYGRGLRMDDIAADLSLEGDGLRIARLTARAGSGTVIGNGRIGLLAADLPVEMNLTADRARPIVSDLITATVSGNLQLKGALRRQAVLSGALRVLEGEIALPERFPPEVAVLDVRRRGAPLPPPPPPPPALTLDLAIRSEGPIFVRGRGIDAEMRGDITLAGAVARPNIGGAFQLVRGSYTLGGQRLDFTSGTVRFDGTGLRHRLDPTLDFLAQTVSSGVTARLAVTGYASRPQLSLSSTPSLPQDEIVAHLLFRQGVKQLSALQLASLAQAAASLGGIGGGFNPLGAVRRTLGLDRLSIGSVSTANSNESRTTVEAGRYVTRNVYVGVRQTLSGGTQTQVQVDVTDRLKALATTNIGGTVQGTAPQDKGSSVGLSYELEY